MQVTLNEIQKYMETGPDPKCPEHPPLAPELRRKISRSIFRHWLMKFLGLEWSYTKKKGLFMKGSDRHLRIREFVIEIHRALRLEETGEYVICFTEIRLKAT